MVKFCHVKYPSLTSEHASFCIFCVIRIVSTSVFSLEERATTYLNIFCFNFIRVLYSIENQLLIIKAWSTCIYWALSSFQVAFTKFQWLVKVGECKALKMLFQNKFCWIKKLWLKKMWWHHKWLLFTNIWFTFLLFITNMTTLNISLWLCFSQIVHRCLQILRINRSFKLVILIGYWILFMTNKCFISIFILFEVQKFSSDHKLRKFL